MNVLLKDEGEEKKIRKGREKKGKDRKEQSLRFAFIVMYYTILPRLPFAHEYRAAQAVWL